MSINKVILVGNVGRTPETRETRSGSTVANLSVATTHRYNNEETTEWHKVVCFGKTAEFVFRYIPKGRQVYVEGRLQTRSYEKDGVKHWTTEIVADTIQALGPKPAAAADPDEQPLRPAATTPADDGDVPF